MGFHHKACRCIVTLIILSASLVLVPGSSAGIPEGLPVSGSVHDQDGAVVSGARVAVYTASNVLLGSSHADENGRFHLPAIPKGRHLLLISAPGFADRQVPIHVQPPEGMRIDVVLTPPPITEQITVTANPGSVEGAGVTAQQVNTIDERMMSQRAATVVAQVAQEETGVHLQRTSPTMAGIYVRGLTGSKVNVFVDGVRFSTSAARGGVNTFLNLIEPSNLRAVEVLRGPSSAQYGSDALGGTIQFLTAGSVAEADRGRLHGRWGTYFNSADAGYGTSLRLSYGQDHFGVSANLLGRRSSRLRPGGGFDSHSAFTRFLGLSSDLFMGSRLPDTAFTQYGGMIKVNWSPVAGSIFHLTYLRSQQDGGKRYDQLLGGDGNLIADLRNLMADLLYVRYEELRIGWLDRLAFTYSFNSQREERVNQGGNGSPLASINHEYERMIVHGLQALAGKQWGSRQSLLLGVEYYQERIHAPSFGFDPATRVSQLRRPRVPDGASYRSGGVYLQDIFELVPSRVRLVGNVRYSVAAYRARAEDSPVVNGSRLWPDDSLRVSNFTFRGGVVVTPAEALSFSAQVSRGFRAPHITDLGTLGLTGSGFEVAAPDIAGLAASVGTTADRLAVSSGRPVTQVGSESSLNYEVAGRFHRGPISTSLSFFVNDIDDQITKQALILPPGAVGQTLGGQPITAQLSNGVVFVTPSSSPVLVRANFDDARIYGFEHLLDLRFSPEWSLATVFTYLHARDKATDLPPNIEGGTPAPDGYLKVRYSSAGRSFWVEPYLHAAARQDRLSSLDLEDRRTGAMRSRSSIAGFFSNGATARGFVVAGPDGRFGTADDRLTITGESLAGIQNRVLGAGVQQMPLFRGIPGYVTFNVRGGWNFGENHELLIDFQNIGDRNYRGISWGLDAPGRGVYVRYQSTF